MKIPSRRPEGQVRQAPRGAAGKPRSPSARMNSRGAAGRQSPRRELREFLWIELAVGHWLPVNQPRPTKADHPPCLVEISAHHKNLIRRIGRGRFRRNQCVGNPEMIGQPQIVFLKD